MALGRRKQDRQGQWVAACDLPQSPGHPFYHRLNGLLGLSGPPHRCGLKMIDSQTSTPDHGMLTPPKNVPQSRIPIVVRMARPIGVG